MTEKNEEDFGFDFTEFKGDVQNESAPSNEEALCQRCSERPVKQPGDGEAGKYCLDCLEELYVKVVEPDERFKKKLEKKKRPEKDSLKEIYESSFLRDRLKRARHKISVFFTGGLESENFTIFKFVAAFFSFITFLTNLASLIAILVAGYTALDILVSKEIDPWQVGSLFVFILIAIFFHEKIEK